MPGWRAGRLGRSIVILLLSIYISVSVPVARVVTFSFSNKSQEIRSFVERVVAGAQGQSDKLILLKGVDSEMFWSVVWNRPFPLFGLKNVWVMDDNGITPPMPQPDRANFRATPDMIHEALKERRAIVLDVTGGQVRDVTAYYPPDS